MLLIFIIYLECCVQMIQNKLLTCNFVALQSKTHQFVRLHRVKIGERTHGCLLNAITFVPITHNKPTVNKLFLHVPSPLCVTPLFLLHSEQYSK